MKPLCCTLIRHAARYVRHQTIQQRILHPERLERTGPYVLASTHLGHVEAFLISAHMKRHVHWISRREHYRTWPSAWVLDAVGAIRIDRTGVSVSAIRSAMRYLGQGNIVGIFPEGGVLRGRKSALRGGVVRGGGALIALRAGVPIVPIVVVGTERLTKVDAWFPGQHTRVRMAVGDAIFPPSLPSRLGRRAARRELNASLAAAFQSTFAELLDAFDMDDSEIG